MQLGRLSRVAGRIAAPEAALDPRPAQGSPWEAGRPNAARIRLFVPSQAWGGRRRREILAAAFLGAALFHVAMLGAIVEVPGLLPHFLQPAPPKPPPPPPEADLVMVKENTPTVGGTPPPDKTRPPSTTPPQQTHAGGGTQQGFKAPNGPPVPPPSKNPLPDPGKADDGKATQVTPPPAPPASNIQVNLDLDGQPGWGLVDERTIAASPDDHYINKPAAYPRAAGMRGEEGTVYLSTLVAPDGHAEQVIVEHSSGYADLDAAARNAVAAWHFQPAIRGGMAVESEMRMAYHFTIKD